MLHVHTERLHSSRAAILSTRKIRLVSAKNIEGGGVIMPWWIVGIIASLPFAAVSIFRKIVLKRPSDVGTSAEQTADCSARKAGRTVHKVFAMILKNGEYLPVTSDEVEEMFAEIKERLKRYLVVAESSGELADDLSKTGKLDDAAFAELILAEADVRRTCAEAMFLYDNLSFNNESARLRFYKIIEDLSVAESDIEFARREIEDTLESIDADGVPPERPLQKTTVQKRAALL
jgi:hypothetical protein